MFSVRLFVLVFLCFLSVFLLFVDMFFVIFLMLCFLSHYFVVFLFSVKYHYLLSCFLLWFLSFDFFFYCYLFSYFCCQHVFCCVFVCWPDCLFVGLFSVRILLIKNDHNNCKWFKHVQVCWSCGATWQPEVPVQTCGHDGARLHPDCWNHAVLWGFYSSQVTVPEDSEPVSAGQQTALPAGPLRLWYESHQVSAGHGRPWQETRAAAVSK